MQNLSKYILVYLVIEKITYCHIWKKDQLPDGEMDHYVKNIWRRYNRNPSLEVYFSPEYFALHESHIKDLGVI